MEKANITVNFDCKFGSKFEKELIIGAIKIMFDNYCAFIESRHKKNKVINGFIKIDIPKNNLTKN